MLSDAPSIALVLSLRPSEWGGWGYRIMPGRSAIVLRSGPGLVVTTTSGTQFAISLADPQTPRLYSAHSAESPSANLNFDATPRPPLGATPSYEAAAEIRSPTTARQ